MSERAVEARGSDPLALLEELLGEAACKALGLYPIPDDLVLSVVIPAFNEVETIEVVVRKVLAVPFKVEVIVVDDGSTDGTGDVLDGLEAELDIKIFKCETNQGKGAALKIGFRMATGYAVIVQDADLEYDPTDYRKLLQPLIEDRGDVVFGSRFIGEQHRVLYFWHSIGNRLLTLLSNAFTNLNLTDMETGYKLFRREIIQQIAETLEESRFGIEPEMTAKLARIPGIRIFEIPISYSGRTYEEGKKIGWRDGVSAIRCILKYGFGR